MDIKKNQNRFLFAFICTIIFFALLYRLFTLELELRQNTYAQTKILYNQNSNPDQELVKTIQGAKKFVYFAIYTLTRENIASALIAAKLRGLEVRGVLDYNQSLIAEEKPWINKFKQYGIKMKIPYKEQGLMHIKMLVTESAYAIGSFNWTTSATYYNDEVLEIGKISAFRNKYEKIFKTLYGKY